MKVTASKGHVLFVFENDMRLEDNQTFNRACEWSIKNDAGLLCLYCLQPWHFNSLGSSSKAIGKARFEFLWLSLVDLRQQLALMGLSLSVRVGSTSDVVSSLALKHPFTAIFHSRSAGLYEQRQWAKLIDQTPDVKFEQCTVTTLFKPNLLPFEISELPKHFTPFRKKVEGESVAATLHLNEGKINGITDELDQWSHLSSVASSALTDTEFIGGEQAGHLHLEEYFGSQAPLTYKTTRNQLMGWQSSTKFSPWLALGCVSPKQIMQQLKTYEKKHGANESTYWIYFELLWREFFYWNAIKQGQGLFKSKNAFDWERDLARGPNEFKLWSIGKTGEPLIDACMRELNHTGYLSNRGRQIAASFLINELKIDWRLGASYFEQMLIDYDVASNWGNWQYIAGVGADPRGGRHFNVEKQQQVHDPEGKYIQNWAEMETSNTHIHWIDLIE